MILRLLTACALSIFVLSGCSTLAEQRQLTLLQNALSTYQKAVRWSEFELAQTYVRSTEPVPAPDFDKLRNIKVTAYDVVKNVTADDLSMSEQVVRIKYYDVNFLVEHTLEDHQTWRYDAEAKRWYLDGRLPAFE